MNASLRQAASAAAIVAVLALAFGGAVFAALSLNEARATVADLAEQSQALRTRENKLPAPSGRDPVAARSFEAKTITQAGAALQQRVEAAIAGAKGRLVSSKLDIETRNAESRIALAAELSIADADLQGLLYDLETGRPYIFVDALEARASETPGDDGALHVSLTLSGQWSGAK